MTDDALEEIELTTIQNTLKEYGFQSKKNPDILSALTKFIHTTLFSYKHIALQLVNLKVSFFHSYIRYHLSCSFAYLWFSLIDEEMDTPQEKCFQELLLCHS